MFFGNEVTHGLHLHTGSELGFIFCDETEDVFAVCVGMEDAEDSQYHPAQQRILEMAFPILQLVQQVPLCYWSVTAVDALRTSIR